MLLSRMLWLRSPMWKARPPLQWMSSKTQNSFKNGTMPNSTTASGKSATKKKKGIRDVGGESPATPAAPLSAPAPMPSSAVAFCTAENYSLSRLQPYLQSHYSVMPFLAEGLLHIRLSRRAPTSSHIEERERAQDSTDALISAEEIVPEAYIFSDGTFVTWGATQSQTETLLERVRKAKAQLAPYKDLETEHFEFYQDPSQDGRISADTIIIGGDLPPHQAKLACSAGMAKSVKLACLETLLDAHLDKNRHIPEVLSVGKKLPLSRAAILQNYGELFSLRGLVNLHSELLDSPDFVWSNHKMEEYFDKISKNLDVKPRIAIFNKKLDYANQVAEVLRNHLHEQHSLKLEWCVIILIAVEIAFEVLHYLERLGLITIPDLSRGNTREGGIGQEGAALDGN